MTEAEQERAAVVAFLMRLSSRLSERAQQAPLIGAVLKAGAQLVADTADAIQRGDHIKEQGE